jgi:hypothetical protein
VTSSGFILDARPALARANHGWPAGRIASVGWAFVVLLVVAFERHLGSVEVWLLAIPVVVCLFLLQLSAPALAASLVAAPLLLGPIARVSLPGGLLLHLGDVAIGVMALGSILRHGRGAVLSLGEFEIPVLLTVLIALLSWIAGLDPVASTPSMVSLLEMLVLFVLTTAAVRNSQDVDAVILGWVGAVGLGSLLVVLSYLRREPLILGSGIEGQQYALSTIASSTYLYRATFFVTGFGYPLPAAILCSMMWIVARKGSSMLRVTLGAGLIIEIVALGLMGGATAAGSVGIGLILLAFWTLWLPKGPQRVMAFGIVLLAGVGVIALALGQVMSPAQLKLLLSRTHTAGSLFERFKIWKNIAAYLLTDPHTMLIGLGPDISIRRGDHPLLRKLFYTAGIQQNAVDSGYLYLLLNYGIFVTLLVVGMALRSLTRLTKLITRSPDPTEIALWLSIAAWMIMAFTQQGAVSKPLFITVQFSALGVALYAKSARRTTFRS